MNPLARQVMSAWNKLQSVLLQIPVIGWLIDFFTLTMSAFVFRTGAGHWVASNLDECQRPAKPLKLYEYEGCPFCRKVREAIAVLDLDCIIYPCPRETMLAYGFATKQSRYRNVAKQIGQKAQFPLLVDENLTNEKEQPLWMYESDEIVKYLWKKYGHKATAPPTYRIAQMTGKLTLFLSLMVRALPRHGLMRIPSRAPAKPLELWEFECSPFCKRVREVLACLELAYVKRSAARGSGNRAEFRERFGHLISDGRKRLNLIQVPLLVDPNTKQVLIESKDIVKYLLDTYKVGEMKDAALQEHSSKKAE